MGFTLSHEWIIKRKLRGDDDRRNPERSSACRFHSHRPYASCGLMPRMLSKCPGCHIFTLKYVCLIENKYDIFTANAGEHGRASQSGRTTRKPLRRDPQTRSTTQIGSLVCTTKSYMISIHRAPMRCPLVADLHLSRAGVCAVPRHGIPARHFPPRGDLSQIAEYFPQLRLGTSDEHCGREDRLCRPCSGPRLASTLPAPSAMKRRGVPEAQEPSDRPTRRAAHDVNRWVFDT